MSTPRTGQLGGFGLTVLGGNPNPNESQTAHPGVVRHYGFHDGSGTTAHDSLGGVALTGYTTAGSTAQSPVFAVAGSDFLSCSLTTFGTTGRNASNAALIGSAASGVWASALATGGSVEFWLKATALPVVNWNSATSASYTTQDTSFNLSTQSQACAGYVERLHVLSLGDPATDQTPCFPFANGGGGPNFSTPILKLDLSLSTNASGVAACSLVMDGFAKLGGATLGTMDDLGWHHVLITWSKAKHFVRAYFDGTLAYSSFGSFNSAPSAASKIRVGGADWPAQPENNGGAFDIMHAPAGVNGGNAAGDLMFLALRNGGAPIQIENLTVHDNPIDQGVFSPIYVAATTSFSVRPTATITQPIRLTQFSAEVLGDHTATARFSQESVEVVRIGDSFARSTQVYAEVLRTLPAPSYSVSATTSMTITATSHGLAGRNLSVSASTSFVASATASTRVGHRIAVSASTSLTVTPTAAGYKPAVRSVSALTSMTVAANGTATVHNPQPYFVSASTAVTMSASASDSLARSLQVAASSVFRLSATAYAPSTFLVSARSAFFASGFGNARTPSVYAAASTSMTIGGVAAKPFVFGPKFVSASTVLFMACTAAERANLILHASAATSIVLSDLNRLLKFGPVFVSAATQFRLAQKTSLTHPGPRFVSAATNLTVATTPTYTRSAILMVSASSAVKVAPAASESAAILASASTAFLASSAGRQNRDIQAGATTAFIASNAPRTGNLKHDSASSTAVFTVSAHSMVTGTLASSRIAFSDLAQAVVWIPWRRTSLTLPAGGNLPHS